jgi:hypothetical protein
MKRQKTRTVDDVTRIFIRITKNGTYAPNACGLDDLRLKIVRGHMERERTLWR